MKSIFFCFLLILPIYLFAQSKFPDWDKNYKLINLENLIQSEKEYSQKVELDKNEAQYYVASNKFRFIAKYTGNRRAVPIEKKKSMTRVVKLKFGKDDFISNIVDNEFQFKVNNKLFWIPIQNVLEQDFLNEVDNGMEVLIYTLFLNEHTMQKELSNNFLISEFSIDWN